MRDERKQYLVYVRVGKSPPDADAVIARQKKRCTEVVQRADGLLNGEYRQGIAMIKWLAKGDVDHKALERVFVDGLVGELQLHINVRSGA